MSTRVSVRTPQGTHDFEVPEDIDSIAGLISGSLEDRSSMYFAVVGGSVLILGREVMASAEITLRGEQP